MCCKDRGFYPRKTNEEGLNYNVQEERLNRSDTTIFEWITWNELTLARNDRLRNIDRALLMLREVNRLRDLRTRRLEEDMRVLLLEEQLTADISAAQRSEEDGILNL